MHLDEEHIEAIAQKIVHNEIRENELEEHIANCRQCKSKLDFFVDFYNHLEEELTQQPDSRIEGFADKISTPRIIRLKYYKPEIDNTLLNGNKNILVLAAETKTQSEISSINVVKFASEPHKVLVRIVEDKNKNNFHLYVLSEKEEYHNQTLIGVSDGEEPINFSVTDKDGCGVIQFAAIRDWHTTNVLIFMPVAKFSFENGIKKEETLNQDSITLNVKAESEHFQIQITSNLEKVHRLLAILDDENKILRDVIDNKVSFTKEQAENIREIRLY
jgi:hypothetical protein